MPVVTASEDRAAPDGLIPPAGRGERPPAAGGMLWKTLTLTHRERELTLSLALFFTLLFRGRWGWP